MSMEIRDCEVEEVWRALLYYSSEFKVNQEVLDVIARLSVRLKELGPDTNCGCSSCVSSK